MTRRAASDSSQNGCEQEGNRCEYPSLLVNKDTVPVSTIPQHSLVTMAAPEEPISQICSTALSPIRRRDRRRRTRLSWQTDIRISGKNRYPTDLGSYLYLPDSSLPLSTIYQIALGPLSGLPQIAFSPPDTPLRHETRAPDGVRGCAWPFGV